MDTVYPQLLFSTPGMVSVFIVVVILEILSVAFLGVAVLEFRAIRHRHVKFFHAFEGGTDADTERTARTILWVYILMTIIVTIVTVLIFVFQPHLL